LPLRVAARLFCLGLNCYIIRNFGTIVLFLRTGVVPRGQKVGQTLPLLPNCAPQLLLSPLAFTAVIKHAAAQFCKIGTTCPTHLQRELARVVLFLRGYFWRQAQMARVALGTSISILPSIQIMQSSSSLHHNNHVVVIISSCNFIIMQQSNRRCIAIVSQRLHQQQTQQLTGTSI